MEVDDEVEDDEGRLVAECLKEGRKLVINLVSVERTLNITEHKVY